MSDEVKKVTVQIRPPKGFFSGEIAIGYYVVVDGYLTMTNESGVPLDSSDKVYLNAGDDARLLACKLVRQRRFGSGPRGWNDKLQYPKLRY